MYDRAEKTVGKPAVEAPTLTVNKVAEYVTANAVRRRAILLAAKYPEKFRGARYSLARDAIRMFLKSGRKIILKEAKDLLKAKNVRTDWQKSDRDTSLLAIDQAAAWDIDMPANCTLQVFNGPTKDLNIGGVRVIVNPDLVVIRESKSGQSIGALKLSIVKGILSDECQKNVAVILHDFTNHYLVKEGVAAASAELSMSLDIFKQNCESCPKAYKRRSEQIVVSCEEIVMLWPSL